MVEQLVCTRLLDQLARVHYEDPVSSLGDDTQVVSDQEDGEAELVFHAHNEAQDLGLDRNVERRRWLVRDEQAGVVGQGGRDHHPLLHPPGKLMRVLEICFFRIVDPDVAQEPDDPVTEEFLALAALMEPDRLTDLPAYGKERVEGRRRILEDHSDLAAPDFTKLFFAQRG